MNGAGLKEFDEENTDKQPYDINYELLQALQLNANDAIKCMIESGVDINRHFYLFEPNFDGHFVDMLLYFDNMQLLSDLLKSKHIDLYQYFSFENKWGKGEDLSTYTRLFFLSMLCHWLIVNNRIDIFQDLQSVMAAQVNIAHQLRQSLLGNSVHNTATCNRLIKGVLNRFDAILNNTNNYNCQNKIKTKLDTALLNIDLILGAVNDGTESIDTFKMILRADKIGADEFKDSLIIDRKTIKCALFLSVVISIIPLIVDLALAVSRGLNQEEDRDPTALNILLLGVPIATIAFISLCRAVSALGKLFRADDENALYYRYVFNKYTALLIEDIAKKHRPIKALRQGVFFSARTVPAKQELELTTFSNQANRLSP